ncbi:ubiquitin carboxyl-terminal hydrolase-domain-containing protein [Cyathus striatus]|nr:ubiquitin carboxyl-terminal hydrolase-domain-containing protein [Cyathus striatus]
MTSTYRPISPITTIANFPNSATALSFDPLSDIIWVGSDAGNVTACYGTEGVRGVSFPVGKDYPVSKVVAGDNHVRAFAADGKGVGSWAKGGMNKWFFQYAFSPNAIVSLSDTSMSHQLAIGLASSELLLLNSMTGASIRQVTTTFVPTQLQFSHSSLLSGSTDGYIRLHDPRTGLVKSGASEKCVKAHVGSIQGLEIINNFAFTIGMGERHSRPFPDPLVKVYDLRTMRPLPPIPFSSGPAFIRAVPKRPSTIAIVSSQGLINIVDVSLPSAPSEFYQLDLASYVTSMAVSPTGAYMAFGDGEGVVHLMTQVEEGSTVSLNGFDGQPIQWPDAPASLADISWTDSTPLNSVGLPYYETQLLSGWSPLLAHKGASHPPPTSIPTQILASVKTNDYVSYAPLPKELRGRRNMVQSSPKKGNGRFRSGKSRIDNDQDSQNAAFDPSDNEVPVIYRHVEIEYSKFGVEDFDFAFYNKTEFSGLETHILNSYTNPIVQVMHYCIPIRELSKSHITTSCPREHCLLCELGFISRMLEDARGTNCQTSNFCKTVGVLAQASNAIELIDYGRESFGVDYAHKIQIFHRFLIEHLSAEGNNFPNNPSLLRSSPPNFQPRHVIASPVTQLLGIDGKTLITCQTCEVLREKDNMTHIVDMVYPRKGYLNDAPTVTNFASSIRHSMFRSITHKATCQSCKQFSMFNSRRSIPSRDLPPILALNACVYNDETFGFWQDTRSGIFLQPQIKLNGQIEGYDDPESVYYKIRALVVKITDKGKRSHLVSIVKVPEAESRLDLNSSWFIFNDFVVRNISEAEALSFPDKWKTPAVIYLERINCNDSLDYNCLPSTIDLTILSRDTSIALKRDPTLVRHQTLGADEIPTPGTLVAIDAEFVSMQQEETEFRSDGTKKVLRPARMSLARVSVLRGNGPREGVPFIDDHIHTSEMIVDYLTEFSGIKFGDLDPQLSSHTLTPLKLVYKKLRLLVDLGCIFVGHGLSKDFRIINIYVPPEQVLDTVDLYFIKNRQRRLSLRFLSWFVLDEHIQTDTHDSIEDARSALNLYKAYQRFEEQGAFDQKLEELYKAGKQCVCLSIHLHVQNGSLNLQ